MGRAVQHEISSAHVIKIPMADGGEGTVDVLMTALNGNIRQVRVQGPLNEFGVHRDRPGAGAAGGLGFSFLSLGAELVPGAKFVEEMTGLKDCVRGADWVLTGEGRSDSQTLYGKLPQHGASIAREAGAEAVLISGSFGSGSERLLSDFSACFSVVDRPATLQEWRKRRTLHGDGAHIGSGHAYAPADKTAREIELEKEIGICASQ
ncbi:glycerate kinase [Paenibacillus thalictri]|uniref:Glycerate kinase n=1 Tax=Paenibacillus thalictri TaxID=2527873 RepID=A0A4Q9DDP1_9BACL|nr:glycerate kinase [Paenibacillus thalictri]TBL68472.1 hypothetical protein EYB31_37885 [Paenibacillus thalictri]